ncbi:MAG TPA: ATP-binding cassette domain-containing protein [Nakamurella sp.]
MTGPLLSVHDLTKHFPVKGGTVRAVDGVSFEVATGGSFGIVGESGCGKTTIARMLVRLTDPTAGQIVVEGRDITRLNRRALRSIRPRVQIVFQDPSGSLNPRHTIGQIVAMPMRVGGIRPPAGVRAQVRDLLAMVGLNPDHEGRYPHEFSGGQRQRVGIARALAGDPRLIVADEPVSSLDASVQAQIINLMRALQRDLGVSFVLISHDLAVVRQLCHRVAVMRQGVFVEAGDRAQVFGDPRHPYTRLLLAAVPGADPTRRAIHGPGS